MLAQEIERQWLAQPTIDKWKLLKLVCKTEKNDTFPMEVRVIVQDGTLEPGGCKCCLSPCNGALDTGILCSSIVKFIHLYIVIASIP